MKNLVFLSLVSFLYLSCSEPVSKVKLPEKSGVVFLENFDTLSNSKVQQYSKNCKLDSLNSLSGSSLQLNSKAEFKLQISVQSKRNYKFSFWQRGKGANIKVKVQGDKTTEFKEKNAYKSKAGWNKVELVINTFFLSKERTALLIIKNSTDHSLLIDDVCIDQLKDVGAQFSLNVKGKKLEELTELRNKAYHSPFIRSDFKKNIAAKLNGKSAAVKLKGDWTDHVVTGVWSFKTTSRKEILYNATQVTFQNLKARNMLREWLFLELCKDAGIVTPFYEVTTLSVNESAPYLCVAEESFALDFIKRKKGYSAPVLRLYEDFLFPHWVKGWSGKNFEIPELENSFIYPYDDEKYAKGKAYKQFYNDAIVLKKFITQDSVTHLIDQDKWATLFAIQSLTKSYHSLTWHNTRFFVNKKGLIEPIAYDGSSNDGTTESWFGGGVYGDLEKYFTSPSVAVSFTNKLFLDSAFLQLYKQKLALYSQKETVDDFIQSRKKAYEQILLKVNDFYDYELPINYVEGCRKRLASEDQDFDNIEFIGKKNLFFRPLSYGKAPGNLFYTSELVRGYGYGDSIRFVNGTNQPIIVRSKDASPVTIKQHSSTMVKKSSGKYFVEVDGEKIEVEICPWIPLS